MVRKEIKRILRIWTQTLLAPLVVQALYFVIFGKLIGPLLQPIHGISYMSFIVPGFVMLAFIRGGYDNVLSSFCSDKFQRNLEEILVSPTPLWIIILGYVLGGLIRGLVIGVLVFLVSLFFVGPHVAHMGVVLFFTVVNGIMISLMALLNGILVHHVDEEDFFRNFALKPLLYLGGVFYSVHSLPMLMQKISLLNPVFYMINGFRFGFLGFSDVNPVLCAIILIVGTVFLAGSNWWFLKKGIGC